MGLASNSEFGGFGNFTLQISYQGRCCRAFFLDKRIQGNHISIALIAFHLLNGKQ